MIEKMHDGDIVALEIRNEKNLVRVVLIITSNRNSQTTLVQ